MNIHRSLYCFHGACLGHENAERRRQAVLTWLGLPVPELTLGTPEHFEAYQAAMRLGREHHQRTGERCWAELTPALMGLEQTRVAILNPQGQEIRRFWVGRSTGWMPCHLSISRRSARGGYPVDLAPDERVRVVRHSGAAGPSLRRMREPTPHLESLGENTRPNGACCLPVLSRSRHADHPHPLARHSVLRGGVAGLVLDDRGR